MKKLIVMICFCHVGFSAMASCPNSTLEYSSLLTTGDHILSNAINHIDSFNYVRKNVEKWQDDGLKVCAGGLIVGKNNYQYFKYLVNLWAINPDGDFVYQLPLMFQSSSVQAHHNVGKKPWYGALRSAVEELSLGIKSDANFDNCPIQSTGGKFPIDILTQLQSGGYVRGKVVDQTFGIMPLSTGEATMNTYLAGWVKEISGAGVYTTNYSPQMLILRIKGNCIDVSGNLNAFNRLLVPVEEIVATTKETYNAINPIERIQIISQE